MDFFSIALTVLGLSLFEIVISVDNAVINADVLGTMSRKARRWFLIWGIIIAVFLVRGLLPWLIIWMSNPSLGAIGALTASFSSDPRIAETIKESAPILLAGGGTFLVFLFFHWIFLEPKHYGLVEEEMIEGAKMTDLAKIFYLEVIDATFSIDGILGAFAFTFSIPLTLIGNGIGALVVRQLTISNIENVKKYKYLKNGAMYSIFALGIVMLADSFGMHIPQWVSQVVTFAIIGFFFWKSYKEAKKG